MPIPAPPDGRVRYRCRHATHYHYGEPVTASHLLAHLTPRPLARQQAELVALVIEPEPALAVARLDWFGNPTTYATFREPHRQLSVTVDLAVTLTPPPPLPEATPTWQQVRDLAFGRAEAADFLYSSPRVPVPDDALADLARPSLTEGRPVLEACLDLMHRINRDFAFDPSATTVNTPVDRVLAVRRGVCQDFAHLMLGALRAFGIPARYVSGYLRTDPPEGRHDWRGAAAGHAWVQAWCGPGAGWLDFDPTNDVMPGTDHVTLGWGRDYDDVCPLRGVILGGGAHSLGVEVRVVREAAGYEP